MTAPAGLVAPPLLRASESTVPAQLSVRGGAERPGAGTTEAGAQGYRADAQRTAD
jgi:hypothetical protein